MQEQTVQQLQIYCYICLLKTNTTFALLSIILHAAATKVAFVLSIDCPVCGRFVAFLFNLKNVIINTKQLVTVGTLFYL